MARRGTWFYCGCKRADDLEINSHPQISYVGRMGIPAEMLLAVFFLPLFFSLSLALQAPVACTPMFSLDRLLDLLEVDIAAIQRQQGSPRYSSTGALRLGSRGTYKMRSAFGGIWPVKPLWLLVSMTALVLSRAGRGGCKGTSQVCDSMFGYSYAAPYP